MNFLDLLTGIIPISSALLSVIAAIASSRLTKQIKKGTDQITIKLNDKKIKIDGYSEEEIVKIISKAIEEEKHQTKKPDEKAMDNPSKEN